ncbi:hypothetical protein BGZ65_003914, partial [Modicella reniformis]
MFEAVVIILVIIIIDICFTAKIVFTESVTKDVFNVFSCFLLITEILNNKDVLLDLAIGIIGTTVVIRNLYLHLSIVKLGT